MKNIEEKVNFLLTGLGKEINIQTAIGECTIEIAAFPKKSKIYSNRLMLIIVTFVKGYGYMGHMITGKKITYFRELPYIGLVDNLEEHIEVLKKAIQIKTNQNEKNQN
jgi:hypothetical protein